MEITEIQKLPLCENSASVVKCIIDARKLNDEVLKVLIDVWGDDKGERLFEKYHYDILRLFEILKDTMYENIVKNEIKEL